MCKAISYAAAEKATCQKGFAVIGFLLRLAIGGFFLFSVFSKFSTPGGWTATAYLANSAGPFAAWFHLLAGNAFVDGLNVYGQLLIGLGFVFGAFLRPASFFAAVLMVLYYFANFTANTAKGLIDEHVIYFFLFALYAYSGFGHVCGIDGILSKQSFIQKRAWLKRTF